MPYASPDALRAYHARRPSRAWLYHRFRAAGGCGECGLPITRYARCLRCRRRGAAVQMKHRKHAA
jgi:hypothetical protein